MFGLSFKKPIVLYSQSIGPFNNYSLPLAKYCMNKVNLIVVRDKITENYLRKIGIKSSIMLAADCAFVLDTSSEEKIKEILINEDIKLKKPLIGISANSMFGVSKEFIKLMANVIDYTIERYNAQVIFVPHVVSPNKKGNGDDRIIAKQIYDLSNYKNKIVLINGEYSPEELKGIIKLCDIFIGGRMHANIAALSSCVPTLALSWSHKYEGIMRELNQEKYVCDFQKITINDFKGMIDDLWKNRNEISDTLRVKVKEQKKSVFKTGKIISDLISV